MFLSQFLRGSLGKRNAKMGIFVRCCAEVRNATLGNKMVDEEEGVVILKICEAKIADQGYYNS